MKNKGFYEQIRNYEVIKYDLSKIKIDLEKFLDDFEQNKDRNNKLLENNSKYLEKKMKQLGKEIPIELLIYTNPMINTGLYVPTSIINKYKEWFE